MALNKSLLFLKDVFLGNLGEPQAKVVYSEGSESGHDHFRIYTQTKLQREQGIAMCHKVYSAEVLVQSMKGEIS